MLLVWFSFLVRFGAYLLGIYSLSCLATCLGRDVPKVVLPPGGHLESLLSLSLRSLRSLRSTNIIS